MRQPIIKLLARYINLREFVTCELQTLSQVIRRQQIERIDFLKIDAEKSELDVLNGIEDADWGKVQRIWDALQQEADHEGEVEWEIHFIDSTIARAHQHAVGAKKVPRKPKP